MADNGDSSGSRSNQNLPSGMGRIDTALNITSPLDVTLTTENQSTVVADIQQFPPTNEEIAQHFQESL